MGDMTPLSPRREHAPGGYHYTADCDRSFLRA